MTSDKFFFTFNNAVFSVLLVSQQCLEEVRQQGSGEGVEPGAEVQRVFRSAGVERCWQDDHVQDADGRHKEHRRRHLRVRREREQQPREDPRGGWLLSAVQRSHRRAHRLRDTPFLLQAQGHVQQGSVHGAVPPGLQAGVHGLLERASEKLQVGVLRL